MVVGCLCGAAHGSAGAELNEARALYLSGQYKECAALCEPEVATRNNEQWHLLLARSLMTSGRYAEALQSITNSLSRDRWNVRLMWQARQVFLANGKKKEADEMFDGVLEEVTTRPRDHRDALSMVVFGQAALERGADAKRVLTSVFEPARKADPQEREVYLAAGNLALAKQDFALAAKKFDEGLKELPEDPDLHYGVARAFAPSDIELLRSSLEAALSRNSNHVGSLLLMVDHSIDAEDFAQALELLDRVEKVNPEQPEAWAYRAVIAHLKNQPEVERFAYGRARKYFPDQPQVDHLIGRKLSQNYRFAEGSVYQRRALDRDPRYSPAKAQLAQDLLRLGKENEGWQLAQEVHAEDGYHVEAYNLTTLHDAMAKFTVLTNGDFQLRMGPEEARLYGEKALGLLARAKDRLTAKYGITLQAPTLVDIFPEQKDFAVRTFGMPGNPGYLGVCFGNVITANGPTANGNHPVNWEAVLWHEFCHVVTLQMTRNKMPRWLSEGISVYEEVQANPAWGQRMNPAYRQMILSGEMTPVSKLSGAFLAPPTQEHLQFAYYQASLVVEFLIENRGLPALRKVLASLAEGEPINDALEKYTLPIAELDRRFTEFAKTKAVAFGPHIDWEKPDEPRADALSVKPEKNDKRPQRWVGGGGWEEWAQKHPTNFWVLTRAAREHVEREQYAEARSVLENLSKMYPTAAGEDSPWRLLAAVYEKLGERDLEWVTLTRISDEDAEAPDIYLRLMALGQERGDWRTVRTNVDRHLAVNPLIPAPYRFLAETGEAEGDWPSAIEAYRALIELGPADPAGTHYRLGRALFRLGRVEDRPEARRQVLLALEEAPRYREALRLLLEIDASERQAALNTAKDPRR